MATMIDIIKRVGKFADDIDDLTEGRGDSHPWGDIRLKAQWISDLMKELAKEEAELKREITRDEKTMKYINHMLG